MCMNKRMGDDFRNGWLRLLLYCLIAVVMTACATTNEYQQESGLPWGGPDDLGGRGPAADTGGGMIGTGMPY
ncbi:MAG: hypothetical protein QM518_04025 [Verrucomicrobiota bacterium]|jgi:hypothetical protein|nr:hypothetical protein [Verrucomicrobiota bacterium]